MSKAIGERLRELREAAGISAYRAAKDSGISQPHYLHLESGKRNPTDEALAKIAPVLGVSFEKLKGWADTDRLGGEGVAGVLSSAPLDDLVSALRLKLEETKAEIFRLQSEIKLLDDKESEIANSGTEEKRQYLDERISALRSQLSNAAAIVKIARDAKERL